MGAKVFKKYFPQSESDGLVFRGDAELPGAVRVYFREDWDHAQSVFQKPGSAFSDNDVNEAAIWCLVRHLPTQAPVNAA